jgi:hypothetical protein
MDNPYSCYPGPLPDGAQAGTLLGWSSAPAQAGARGLLDCDESRTVAIAAAAHPAARWCVTLTGAHGTALAQAMNADLDHTVHWPDWTVEQVTPGVTRWTLPSGRIHVTTSTRYDS